MTTKKCRPGYICSYTSNKSFRNCYFFKKHEDTWPSVKQIYDEKILKIAAGNPNGQTERTEFNAAL